VADDNPSDSSNLLDDIVAKAKEVGEQVREFAEDAFDNVKEFASGDKDASDGVEGAPGENADETVQGPGTVAEAVDAGAEEFDAAGSSVGPAPGAGFHDADLAGGGAPDAAGGSEDLDPVGDVYPEAASAGDPDAGRADHDPSI